ncbi:MAG TPA: hypothetical protein VJU86_12845 [Pyrinomonadaceae bacterium]|nr:hypothetical protein [Pyrinomonadaceae bacterium]
MNYFNYFTEIEDAFVRRRGKHLLVSSIDWALIESWKEMQIPLHVALRGIEKAFDSWESKPRKRAIKSLLYCQEEVEAQFAEWAESRVGANDETQTDETQSEGMPFSRAALVEHLRKGRSELVVTRTKLLETSSEFSDALQRAETLLQDLEEETENSTTLNAQKLEQSLTGLERMLADALRLTIDSVELQEYEREVKEQLKPYRKHMEKAAYDQTFDNLLLKRLRDRYGVPRLSLFYL